MFTAALDAGGKPEHLYLIEAGGGRDRHHLWFSFGEGAGLVDHQRIDLFHALQRFCIFDQHASLRAAAYAHHDRHRRGEPECAGAGDDEYTDRRHQPVSEARFRPEGRPGGKGQKRNSNNGWHEPGGDLVGQPLDGRAAALRLRNHLHDLRQQRVAADSCRHA